MPSKFVPATGRATLDTLADILNVNEAAAGTGVSSDTIRSAIKSGALRAFTPGGNGGLEQAKVGGRGLGYRIHKAELARWYLGEPIE